MSPLFLPSGRSICVTSPVMTILLPSPILVKNIFICSRVVARVIDGASYDKLLFIISDENEKLRTFILEDLERSATFIKARGMYSEEEKDMIFLVVDRKEVHAVQRKVQEIDPKAFFVVTDAYDTYGEGFKPFPEAGAIQAQ